jgi:hypothetical protein
MDTPEKDTIDAKLQAVIERLNGDTRAHQIATDARLDKLDRTLEHVRHDLDARITQAENHFQQGLQSVRDEFNARLNQVETNVQHGLQSVRDEFSAKLTQVESNVQHGLQSVRDESNAKLAQLEASFQRSLADAIKWMIGTMVGLTMVSITVTSVLFLRAAPKQDESVKVQTSALSSPHPAPDERRHQLLRAGSALAAQSTRTMR